LLTHRLSHDNAQVFQETDLKALKDLASKRGDDAEKILNETYERESCLFLSICIDRSRRLQSAEIKEILQTQADKAKKLGEETKEAAKKQAK
jgi:hypothetical protein